MALPAALLESLTHLPGFNGSSFEAVHASGEQVTSIRLNPDKPVNLESWTMTPVPWCPYGFYLSSRPSFTLDPFFHAGAYYVQEASSMFLWEALKQLAGDAGGKKILDLCAAPGGKSTLLASYFPHGLVVANEVIKTRAAVLVENITKWGKDNVVVTNNDPSHFQALQGFFDVMVVDAPCSGSGLFRKDPDAVKEWNEDSVQLCSQRQQRILSDALPSLKEGGLLLYSTCSYSSAEDEAIADWLVTEMGMESLSLSFPAVWGVVETGSPQKKAAGYRFYPDQVKGEGFFLAVFRKTEDTRMQKRKEQKLDRPAKQEETNIRSFTALPHDFCLFKQQESVRAIAGPWLEELQVLAAQLYIRKAGIEIGLSKGKDLIPSHELAMSRLWKPSFSPVAITREQALQYLRRKDIHLPGAAKGWQLLAHEELPLGWVKVLDNRINNYYPSEWRILKE